MMPRYIDKEKVIDALDQSINIFDATDRIKALKASDVVERKRGRWKGEGLGDYRCSLCGEVTRHTRTNYCPNCGARMKG